MVNEKLVDRSRCKTVKNIKEQFWDRYTGEVKQKK